jgi:S1-C subfamily serine protease
MSRRRVVRGRRWPAVLTAAVALAGTLSSISLASSRSATRRQGEHPPVALTAMDGGVVDVTSKLGQLGASAAGTGMVVTPQGEVLTNNHVIRGATDIRVTVPGGGQYSARVLGTDAREDVALLQVVGAPGLTPATFGDSSTATVGEPVNAIGNAGGVGGAPSVSAGTITRLHQSVTVTDDNTLHVEHLHDLIQTDADVQPGDSGGPLIDAADQVIGMDTAAAVAAPGEQGPPEGFAIPINGALAVAHQIEAGTSSADVHIGPAATLGVEVFPGAFAGRAVLVTRVISGSPAQSAGLASGDLITSLDRKAVRSSAALTRRIEGHHPGDAVRVRWVDPDGASSATTVQLATGPPA